MFRLSTYCYRRRWIVLGAWVVAFVVLLGLGKAAGGSYANNFTLPASESQRAYQLLQTRFPAQSGDTVQVVVKADAGVNDPQVQSRFESLLSDLAKQPHVSGIQNPYGPGGERQVSKDGTIAYATVQFNERANNIPKSESQSILNRVNAANGPGMEVAAGGNIISAAQRPHLSSEAIGLTRRHRHPAHRLRLGAGHGPAHPHRPVRHRHRLRASSSCCPHAIAVPDVRQPVGRHDRHRGRASTTRCSSSPATARASTTAWIPRTRCVTAIDHRRAGPCSSPARTVVISLLGMFLIGISFVGGLAVGAAAAVLITMVASVTLLPALLGFVGRNIDKLQRPRPAPQRREPPGDRLATAGAASVQRRPWPFAGARPRHPAGPGPARCSSAPRARPTPATTPSPRPPAGPTTCWPRGSARAPTGPCSLAAEMPRPADLAVLAAPGRRRRGRPPASPR